MGAWLSNVSLKYKFWAVNAVAFVTTLLLVLYAVHLEQRARAEAAQAQAAAQAQLLAAWPAGQPLPRPANVISWSTGPKNAAGCGGLTGVTPLSLYLDWVRQTARQWGAPLP